MGFDSTVATTMLLLFGRVMQICWLTKSSGSSSAPLPTSHEHCFFAQPTRPQGGLEGLGATLLGGRHGLVEIGQPQLYPASATIRREGLQSADLLSCFTGRAVQADGGWLGAVRCCLAQRRCGPLPAPRSRRPLQ